MGAPNAECSKGWQAKPWSFTWQRETRHSNGRMSLRSWRSARGIAAGMRLLVCWWGQGQDWGSELVTMQEIPINIGSPILGRASLHQWERWRARRLELYCRAADG